MSESPHFMLAEDEEELKALAHKVDIVLNFLVSWLPDSFRTGLSAFAISLIAVGFEVVGGARRFGLVLATTGGALGAFVVILTIVHEVRKRAISDRLAEFIVRADNLMSSVVYNEDQYRRWVEDLNFWHKETIVFLSGNLSQADVALFRNTSGGVRCGFRGFSSEHTDYKNTLMHLISNLRALTERFLTER